MILEETYTLANGVNIPKLGLGTWFIDNDDAAQAVRDAAEVGYRHIDTAQAYGNEAGVGEGIRSCGVPREQMFVTIEARGRGEVIRGGGDGDRRVVGDDGARLPRHDDHPQPAAVGRVRR